MTQDHYSALGLETGATKKEIIAAYRLYARKFHPDKHKGDPFFEKKFIEIKDAYEFLINNKEFSFKKSKNSSSNNINDNKNIIADKEINSRVYHARKIARDLLKKQSSDIMKNIKKNNI